MNGNDNQGAASNTYAATVVLIVAKKGGIPKKVPVEASPILVTCQYSTVVADQMTKLDPVFPT